MSRKKVILITGANGEIGNSLIDYFNKSNNYNILSLDLKPLNWSPDNRPRRQDVSEQYIENGAFYITTKE